MYDLPIFFLDTTPVLHDQIVLAEDIAKHIVQVLRMKRGECVQLTNGKGGLFTAEIIEDRKNKCEVKVIASEYVFKTLPCITIAISLLKNANRFEWFLEKATEIGVAEIIPLLCERTERQHFRFDRMQKILISAMLQSQQVWLPKLHKPTLFTDIVIQATLQQKFIAHCLEENKQSLKKMVESNKGSIILIGPEGDFTQNEIELALQHGFSPVSLGSTRLRTEKAGIVAATLLIQ